MWVFDFQLELTTCFIYPHICSCLVSSVSFLMYVFWFFLFFFMAAPFCFYLFDFWDSLTMESWICYIDHADLVLTELWLLSTIKGMSCHTNSCPLDCYNCYILHISYECRILMGDKIYFLYQLATIFYNGYHRY